MLRIVSLLGRTPLGQLTSSPNLFPHPICINSIIHAAYNRFEGNFRCKYHDQFSNVFIAVYVTVNHQKLLHCIDRPGIFLVLLCVQVFPVSLLCVRHTCIISVFHHSPKCVQLYTFSDLIYISDREDISPAVKVSS